MGILGLDQWLTSPPEDPDWIEVAEKLLKQDRQPRDEQEADLLAIIEGLLTIIQDEL